MKSDRQTYRLCMIPLSCMTEMSSCNSLPLHKCVVWPVGFVDSPTQKNTSPLIKNIVSDQSPKIETSWYWVCGGRYGVPWVFNLYPVQESVSKFNTPSGVPCQQTVLVKSQMVLALNATRCSSPFDHRDTCRIYRSYVAGGERIRIRTGDGHRHSLGGLIYVL